MVGDLMLSTNLGPCIYLEIATVTEACALLHPSEARRLYVWNLLRGGRAPGVVLVWTCSGLSWALEHELRAIDHGRTNDAAG
jgi:hypothetical protein